MNGFRVATCPWRDPQLARKHVRDMVAFRKSSTPEMMQNFRGMIQTVWNSTDDFMDDFSKGKETEDANSSVACFKAMFDEIKKVEGASGT